jgi:hypothetical protein
MEPESSLRCSQQIATILRQINPIYILSTYFPKIHFNIILNLYLFFNFYVLHTYKLKKSQLAVEYFSFFTCPINFCYLATRVVCKRHEKLKQTEYKLRLQC